MEATTRTLIQTAGSPVHHWLPAYRWIPLVGGFATFALACAAGANDLPISFATSIGAGALTMLQAVIVASTMEFTGAAAVGNLTADARYINLWKETPPDAGLLMWGFFVVIIAATIWLAVATYLELPVSSSTCIQGALLGVGLTTHGVDGIYWAKEDDSSALNVGGVASILLSWTVVPAVAAAMGFLFFGFMKLVLLRSQYAEKRTIRALPLYYGVTVMAIIFLILLEGAPRTTLNQMKMFKVAIITSMSGVLAAILALTIVVPLAQKRLVCFSEGTSGSSSKKMKNDLLKEESRKEQDPSLRDVDVMTAEELLRQFKELRVLETVYEEGEEDGGGGGESPAQITIRCSPVRGLSSSSSLRAAAERGGGSSPSAAAASSPPTTSFGQLLAGTPNRLLWYRRLRRPPPKKLTAKQRLLRRLRHLRATTIDHKLEYGRETLVMHALAEKFDEKAEMLFSFLQILTTMAIAFVQGSRDIAGCVAPYAALKELYNNRASFSGIIQRDASTNSWVTVEEWMLVIVASGAMLGVALWGWKVGRSVGGELAFMSPSRGFSAQISLIVVLSIAAQTRLPISIPHILVGSIVGVGVSDSAKNVNWRLISTFVGAWVLTLFSSCGLAASLYSFTIFSPAYLVI